MWMNTPLFYFDNVCQRSDVEVRGKEDFLAQVERFYNLVALPCSADSFPEAMRLIGRSPELMDRCLYQPAPLHCGFTHHLVALTSGELVFRPYDSAFNNREPIIRINGRDYEPNFELHRRMDEGADAEVILIVAGALAAKMSHSQ